MSCGLNPEQCESLARDAAEIIVEEEVCDLDFESSSADSDM